MTFMSSDLPKKDPGKSTIKPDKGVGKRARTNVNFSQHVEIKGTIDCQHFMHESTHAYEYLINLTEPFRVESTTPFRSRRC